MAKITDRFKNAWNAFTQNKDPTSIQYDPVKIEYGSSSSVRPDRLRLTRGNDRSLVTAVFNRMALDCAAIDIRHVRLDKNKRFTADIDSNMNECFKVSPNLDQTPEAFFEDVYMSMFDEGCVAIVPIDTTKDPFRDTFDIYSMRTGKIVEWFPKYVKVQVYNEKIGRKQEIMMPKDGVAIIENPFYAVMNSPNSTAQRLMRKLALLDYVDEQNGSGNLNMIVQLPYSIRSAGRRQQANERRDDLENQLATSKRGIIYTDNTEKITQLNRPLDNQLLTQIENLKKTLYSQLGITEEILNGTADEKVMNNYYNRTIEPIVSAVVQEMYRKFLSSTARTQNQAIKFFRDPFKLVATTELAELADKFTRNEIMTSNEFRQVVGMAPAEDPRANELRNSNISEAKDEQHIDVDGNNLNLGGNPIEGEAPPGMENETDEEEQVMELLRQMRGR